MAANPIRNEALHPYAQANSVIATLRAEMYVWAQASARVRNTILDRADLPLLGYMSDMQADEMGRGIDSESLAASDVTCAIYRACELAVDVPAYAKLIRDNVRTICLAAGWSGKGFAATMRRVQTDRWLASSSEHPAAIRAAKALSKRSPVKRAIAFRNSDGNCTWLNGAGHGACAGCETCPGCGVHPPHCPILVATAGIPMPARCADCGANRSEGHDLAYHASGMPPFHTLSQIDRNIRLDNLANVDLLDSPSIRCSGYVTNY